MLTIIAAVALAGATTTGGPSAPNVQGRALVGLISADDYPKGALARGEQGAVQVDIHVDAAGGVSGCNIRKSSGFVELDARTCAIFVERARFSPARDAQGRAVPSQVTQTVNWRLAGEGAPSEPWAVKITTAYGGDGKPLSCAMTMRGVSPLWGQSAPCSLDKAIHSIPDGTTSTAMLMEFNPGPAPPPVLGPGDSILARAVVEMKIDATGRVLSCRTVETRTPVATDHDFCTPAYGSIYRPRLGPGGKPAPFDATMATTVIAHVEAGPANRAKP